MDQLRAGPGFSLASVDPRSTPGVDLKKDLAIEEFARNGDTLAEWQEKLWAEAKSGSDRRMLVVLQAMDTAGKGGIIRHVFGGVDPQGVQVASFGVPTEEEKQHDFLWRVRPKLPRPGVIGIFDRSYYEDVLIHRVRGLSSPEAIEERYGLINEFERELASSGTTIIKVMLHISLEEQKKRLQERLDRPEKNWKFNPGDIDERMRWPAYQEAYQIAIERTSTPAAPWFVVPADRKWFARLAVQEILLGAIRVLNPQWPKADFDVAEQKKRLAAS